MVSGDHSSGPFGNAGSNNGSTAKWRHDNKGPKRLGIERRRIQVKRVKATPVNRISERGNGGHTVIRRRVGRGCAKHAAAASIRILSIILSCRGDLVLVGDYVAAIA